MNSDRTTDDQAATSGTQPPCRLFDAHCHLQDDRLVSRIDAVMERATQAGVTTMMCCGTRESDWLVVAEIAGRFAGVRMSFGLHPWHVATRTATWLDTLQKLLRDHPAAVGEIGLDHAMGPETFAAQEDVFLAQLSLAVERDRPVSVHCRRAWGRMMELLDNHGWPPRGVMFHSYSGGPGLVPALVRRGAWFSFSGSITHDKNLRGREAIAIVPKERLLMETDAPDIMPAIPEPKSHLHFLRHAPVNEPANLTHIAATIARLRDWTTDQTAAITHRNAETFFPL